MTVGPPGEFGFELRTCRWLERAWPLDGGEQETVIARQLGTRRRRWDTIVIESTAEQLRQRAAFGPRHIDSDLRHVLRDAPGEWTYYRDALPEPGYPWRYVREAIHTADDRDLLDVRKRQNRIQIRRRHRYPDWVDRVIAIENKPDLEAAAARDLQPQLEHDVAVAIADEVWVATRQTDETIEPALREDLPTAVGILTVDQAALTGSVAWYARRLPAEEPGTRILDRPTGGDRDGSAARFEYVAPADKRETRLGIAERAYERGWRSYVEHMRPDCRHFQLTPGEQLLPWCEAHDRHQTVTECAGSCEAFEPEPPAWRSKGWPLDGGPGASCRRLLERRRQRRRPGLE